MKFAVQYPIEQHGRAPEFGDAEGIREFVRIAEESGLDAVALSEHPAPSRKWLASGGHETFDTLTALAFMAGATARLRLIAHLLVLPYHNPLLAAKALATVDRMSAGRLTIGVGPGYLRSEFAALGVDFTARNELFEESLRVLTRVWPGGPITLSGRDFEAVDQVQSPPPVTQPAPPLWIGGNGRAARRRVVEFGQGWSPMISPPSQAAAVRTAAISTLDELANAIADLRDHWDRTGRAGVPEVFTTVPGIEAAYATGDFDEYRYTLDRYAAAGVTWAMVRVPAASYPEAVAALRTFGREVVARSESGH
ncbi:TIGR03619 family F420-dependent LLM class oxidoreductase [Nocardia jinanensis]|uniref:LLM class F420-dependent oxidoreductase n=1 Tax=Nocardia jinanensis TaxID=382504 RepID=A0A917RLD3_9NOCA|nr:TIGR03619 family F420-dependent LLM class oxidoreductase [Nocardia jinanensis]GGL12439.1 LLM class F420-dependent oxidoreductase [Nocardia jinanensis]